MTSCKKMILTKKSVLLPYYVTIIKLYCVAYGYGCVQDYYELEEAMIRDKANLDNLTLGFFPANLQPSLVVEIFYHVNGTAWSELEFQPRPAPRGCASFTQKPSSSCRYV